MRAVLLAGFAAGRLRLELGRTFAELGWLAEKPTRHGFNTDLWTAGVQMRLPRQPIHEPGMVVKVVCFLTENKSRSLAERCSQRYVQRGNWPGSDPPLT